MRTLRASLVAGVLSLLVAAPAGASVTFGSTLNPANAPSAFLCSSGSTCDDFNTIVAGGQAASPIDGVITSWAVRSGGDSTGVALRVFHPLGGGIFRAAGTSEPVGVANDPTVVQRYLGTRLPIAAGDLIGLDRPSGSAVLSSGVTGSSEDEFDPPLADGSSGSPFIHNGAEVLVQATVEPDVDHDQYGDESQDYCPGDPTLHTRCEADLSVAKSSGQSVGLIGGQMTFTVTVHNNGSSPAEQVVLTDPLPGSATPVSATAPCLIPGNTVRCSLGRMASGETRTIAVVVRPGADGRIPNVATVVARTDDPNSSNNSAGASFMAVAPRATLAAKSAKVGRRLRVPIRVACQAGGEGCDDVLTLTAGKKVLASKLLHLRAGTKQTVTVKLPSSTRRLFRRGRLRLAVKLLSADHSTVTRSHLTLKR